MLEQHDEHIGKPAKRIKLIVLNISRLVDRGYP